ncbi:MAG: dienelactone hydrolase family protein [Ignavibacteria bacterium]|nr:dienelactone hydrolase family protein [Ignavibacteria bacterium]
MRPLVLFLALVALGVTMSHAKVKTKDITYEAEGVKLKGYLAFDDAIEGKRPGILVVHEWYGHNDYARKRAEMLAGLGYVAFALDMYGDGKLATHPEDAGKFAGEVMSNMPAMKARFNAALAELKKDPHVDSGKIGAIGYCFGGGVVLNMARSGASLRGVVSFHGSLGTPAPAEKGNVKTKILVCNGADDSFVSSDAIAAFKKEMNEAGADYRFVQYENAIHSFTNPGSTEIGKKFGLNIGYNEKADKQSWDDMKEFFTSVFGE